MSKIMDFGLSSVEEFTDPIIGLFGPICFNGDLLTEILLVLPVKSIVRFNCASKQWRHLFRNPDFVSRHFRISRKKKRLILYYCEGTLDTPVVVMRFFVDRDLVDYRDMHGQLPPHFVNMFVFTFCVGGGLICLLDWTNSRITLSNPAAREFKILPECNEDIPDKSYTFAHTLGFGLDPLSNDYKVVHIRSYVDEENNKVVHGG
ncbi:F-box protein At2g15640-like [Hibiscus syriacus]|uniref:F-box protein At2g15640-like n=1 Tax=Hibiscus syriacus TaxID=106335 RepID=UPI0019229743|nr:F-box protein At2g15640-like [Hibiscus syriacus]